MKLRPCRIVLNKPFQRQPSWPRKSIITVARPNPAPRRNAIRSPTMNALSSPSATRSIWEQFQPPAGPISSIAADPKDFAGAHSMEELSWRLAGLSAATDRCSSTGNLADQQPRVAVPHGLPAPRTSKNSRPSPVRVTGSMQIGVIQNSWPRQVLRLPPALSNPPRSNAFSSSTCCLTIGIARNTSPRCYTSRKVKPPSRPCANGLQSWRKSSRTRSLSIRRSAFDVSHFVSHSSPTCLRIALVEILHYAG